MTTRDWNAGVYDRVADPQAEWGREVVERLGLRGDERVLDAGCGTGRVTRQLIDRYPGITVLACDAAPSMVETAREALPEATVFEADLLELELDEPVDVVFSTAVFHWIADHDRLFARMHAALVPGGRMVVQCGGKGNIQLLVDTATEVAAEPPYAEHLAGTSLRWEFPDPETTAERLARAGFTDVRTWLEDKDAYLADPHAFVANVNLREQLPRLPEALRDAYVDTVIDRMGVDPFYLAYVRLNIEATA